MGMCCCWDNFTLPLRQPYSASATVFCHLWIVGPSASRLISDIACRRSMPRKRTFVSCKFLSARFAFGKFGSNRNVVNYSQYSLAMQERVPKNVGKKIGTKRPLTQQRIWASRYFLDRDGRLSDRALFSLAVDRIACQRRHSQRGLRKHCTSSATAISGEPPVYAVSLIARWHRVTGGQI